MSFDPYHKWLGIRPEDQPPDHYRLLGIHRFEDDPDVIDSAADQRMTHLRSFQNGKHSRESKQLLNEVSAARVCLLESSKKTVYDERLRKAMQQAEMPSPLEDIDYFESSNSVVSAPTAFQQPVARPSKRQPPWALPAVIGGGSLAVLVVVLITISLLKRRGTKSDCWESRDKRISLFSPSVATKLPSSATAAS